MLFAILNCSNHSGIGKSKWHFFILPAVIKHQGEQMFQLSSERQHAWLEAISREDLNGKKLNNVFVCGKHFKRLAS